MVTEIEMLDYTNVKTLLMAIKKEILINVNYILI